MRKFYLAAFDLIKFFRPTFAGSLIRYGVAMLVIALGGYNIDFLIERYSNNGHVSVGISNSNIPAGLLWALVIIGFALILIGLGIGVTNWNIQRRSDARKKNVVIELRGLSGTVNTSLKSSIAQKLPSEVDEILVDIGQHVTAGTHSELEKAIEKINNLHSRVETAVAGKDREDVLVHIGSIAPIPFQFLSGVILDDEFSPKIWEFERVRNEWQTLDQNDPSIVVNELINPSITSSDQEVVLAISATYEVLESTVANTWPTLKVARIGKESPTPNSIWAESDQQLIVDSFMRVMALLKNRGVRKVHLALAASASICIKLGRHFDQRNFPEITIYQFDRSLDKYTWGVEISSTTDTVDPKKGKLIIQ